MRVCRCPRPVAKINKPFLCVRCGDRLGSEWDQTDDNFHDFWMRVVGSYQGFNRQDYKVPPEQQTLWLQTKHREKTGRTIFGHAYLNRDNRVEAREELADAMVYLYEEVLQARRDGYDPEWDVVLGIADDIISAHAGFDNLRRKHRGSP